MGWHPSGKEASYEAIHRALLSGLLSNIAHKSDSYEYVGLHNKKSHIFPGSVLFQKKPDWIMSAELVETTRVYARTVASIRPEWIEKLAAHMVKRGVHRRPLATADGAG